MTTLTSPPVSTILDRLYADAQASDPAAFARIEGEGDEIRKDYKAFFTLMKDAYLPVNPRFGRLLYLLVRMCKATRIVEFGTSFGISTLFLAAGLRDNGGGTVITTEFQPEKAARARSHFTEAGLADLVDLRIGDALETLKGNLGTIDLALFDGAKELYLPVLRLIEPHLAPDALLAADNTDMAGTAPYLAFVRDPANGFLSLDMTFTGGNEISLRVG